MTFPKGFAWGASASAYQVEGGADVDGRGLSIWESLAERPGAILNGDTGRVSCDHYHRFREDVGLMRQIGLRAYRMSVAWPRVMPEGAGAINENGLAFYDALVDELLGAGIEPWVTLYHWDLPQELFYRGGWLNREIVDWFEAFTRVVVDRLSDRVSRWMTINEPQVFIGFGYGDGKDAPGQRLGMRELLQANHNILLSHGRATDVIRSSAKKKPQVGWAPVGVVSYPASPEPEHVEAARRDTLSVRPRDLWCNTWYNDPIVFGTYPEDGLKHFAPWLPRIKDGDLEAIRRPLDFLGLNIYQGFPVTAGTDGPVRGTFPPGHPKTRFTWPVTPEVLYWGPRFLAERYRVPIVMTENGMSGHDWVSLDGRVHDQYRIDFTARYLRELGRAIEDGVDVRGYFHWSILDNFEWTHGYDQRFGLIHVDYATQKRTLKDSAHWYRQVIETNGANLA